MSKYIWHTCARANKVVGSDIWNLMQLSNEAYMSIVNSYGDIYFEAPQLANMKLKWRWNDSVFICATLLVRVEIETIEPLQYQRAKAEITRLCVKQQAGVFG